MATLDASVVLGLAGKVAAVFVEPGTYLSFPLAPIGIGRARLSAPDAELCALVNEIPDGPIWQPDGIHGLWDVYADVLAGSQLAQPARSDADELAFEAAYDLLYDTAAGGTGGPAPTRAPHHRRRRPH